MKPNPLIPKDAAKLKRNCPCSDTETMRWFEVEGAAQCKCFFHVCGCGLEEFSMPPKTKTKAVRKEKQETFKI